MIQRIAIILTIGFLFASCQKEEISTESEQTEDAVTIQILSPKSTDQFTYGNIISIEAVIDSPKNLDGYSINIINSSMDTLDSFIESAVQNFFIAHYHWECSISTSDQITFEINAIKDESIVQSAKVTSWCNH